MATLPILELTGISKDFPGVKALSNVDFRLFSGEVHTIMGQNGAGKSTLVKVLTGVHPPDQGRILLEGQEIHPQSTLDAQKLGISTVYQEVNLCLNLSVAENIFIGRYPMRGPFIDWALIHRQSKALLADLDIDIDVTAPLSKYSLAIQQMVAISRAIGISAKVLVLDEPTSSLDKGEVQMLFAVIRRLCKQGIAVLFITHFLDQTYEISDRITVLRNGELEGEYPVADLSRLMLVNKMLGFEPKQSKIEAIVQNNASDGSTPAYLQARGLGRRGALEPVDLDSRKGEVLGLCGLLGSGRTELARLLFGADKADCGEVRINGNKVRLNTPRSAIGAGIGFCSEDRKLEGAILELSVRENIILALQARAGVLRRIPRKRQNEIANEYVKSIGIKTPNIDIAIGKLSGGNQQKALLARWLATAPQMLIIDEPTRGIDVVAKIEIMDSIIALCRKGMAILFISSELEEVIRCSDRLTIMRDRQAVAQYNRGELDEDSAMQVIAGGVHG